MRVLSDLQIFSGNGEWIMGNDGSGGLDTDGLECSKVFRVFGYERAIYFFFHLVTFDGRIIVCLV